MSELKDVLAAGAKEMGINLTADQLLKIEKYYSLLIEANKSINLTAITDEREAAIKHFLDSLTCLWRVKVEDGFKVMDIGTGAGFPGLPVKIYQPGIHLTLVEALEKKVKFLREVVAALDLAGTVVIHARAEDIGRDKAHREQYDLVLSRAVAALPVLAEYCLPAVKSGHHKCKALWPVYRHLHR
jgi:16S rRNA (guanine527-N7)-methyltransferase